MRCYLEVTWVNHGTSKSHSSGCGSTHGTSGTGARREAYLRIGESNLECFARAACTEDALLAVAALLDAGHVKLDFLVMGLILTGLVRR